MAMTIGEASDVALLLQALSGETNGQTIDAEKLTAAMHRLNERAAKAMQLSRIVQTPMALDVAAQDLSRRYGGGVA